MNQKVKEGYNRAANAYSNKFRDQFKSNRHLDMLIQKLEKGSTIVDIGCGSGAPIDAYLVRHGFAVTGIDISEEQIKLAKENVPEATYEVMDMSDLKKEQFQVDAVVSFYALFHIPREQHLHVVQLMRSFLRPNGLLLITMGASEWEGKDDDFCGTEMYWSHFGVEQNKELITTAGFSILFDEIDTTGDEKHLIVLARAV